MRYNQRDVVEINFLFPDGQFKPHPAIIISNDELQETEGFIYLVLVTSKNYNSQYIYELTDEMLTKPMQKNSYVKCHIITGNIERDVIRKLSTMRLTYFEQMKEKIIKDVF